MAGASKGDTPKQILSNLRQVEVAVANGKQVAQAARGIGLSQHTYYRWCNEYGGLSIDQAKKLKKLERENAQLNRAVAEPTLGKLILKKAAECDIGDSSLETFIILLDLLETACLVDAETTVLVAPAIVEPALSAA